jgi:hypothetical protein
MTRARAIERADAESMSREWPREFIELEIIQFLQQAPGRCTHCIIATLGNNFYYWGLPALAAAALARWIACPFHPRPKKFAGQPAELSSRRILSAGAFEVARTAKQLPSTPRRRT